MSAQIWIPQSRLTSAGSLLAGQWIRGIPGLLGNAVGTGLATPQDQLSGSPPTLLEEYELYSYSLAMNANVNNATAFASAPQITLELALLVCDRVAYTVQQTVTSILETGGVSAYANAWFVSDLVNPLRLRARDRLSIRIGMMSSLAANNGWALSLAQIYDPFVGIEGLESTLSYNVNELPARRRL